MAPQSKDVFDAMLSDVGLDPTDVREGKEDPIGIGNLAAANVIAARANDGAPHCPTAHLLDILRWAYS